MKTHGGHRQGAGRKPLPEDERKRPVLIKLPPRLIAWMDSQEDSRALLIESAMAEVYGLCPDCFRPWHLYHNCELNPVANPKEDIEMKLAEEKEIIANAVEIAAEEDRTRDDAARFAATRAEKYGVNVASAPYLHDILCEELDKYSWFS